MGNNQTEKAFEEKRLAQTISLAEEQLKQAKEAADKKKSEIIEAKKDVRENTEHGITSLYTSDGFEALVELSQYINPVTDKIIDYEEEEHKILLLEKMIKSPYFARIDFKFDDEDEFEKIYIGRSSLRKNSYQEMYVYDWRSPIASVFYRFMTGEAFYDAPCGRVTGELNLKRQYEIKNGILEYFFDSDVQIVDEFLRQLLSQNTTAKMKAIVETIQHEQDVVIRDTNTTLKYPITITFSMWIWKTSTSPMFPFTLWARNSYPCTLCICRRLETDPTFSHNPAISQNTMKTRQRIMKSRPPIWKMNSLRD